ncbi:hypothetical protein PLESTB_000072400 [Pleodorina starrii]|uniref:Disease resistance R13L4/SHOC-2-like LRR domain-containing protein n=1 Tax=Pleodorina starrii TaxID=330485 RepID=A0A9W6EXA2_9CHLO|nr:hypothetical protein PLESTM_000068000 [Pleodorina starrii]GLC48224.1 hypothetical protein PLESTB_000072400 [Pleodorina starrii]GLC66514.1 hypothetical protein PLESTF_000438700 [Pleodorina starrii]
MQRVSTYDPTLASCQSATAATAAYRLPPLRTATFATRPTAGHFSSADANRCRPPPNGAPDPGAIIVPAIRASTSCSAYSRSSWRTAILSEEQHTTPDAPEAGSHPAVATGPEARNAFRTDSGREAQSGGADGDVDGDGCALGGTLTAAELRVKLMLAQGSGRLDLTDCRLQRLPPEVLQLTDLEELQLSGNCLTQLPEDISRLTSLRRLGLAGNMLSSLPPGIGALTALEGLWLHGNLLASLPQQLGKLGALRALSLAGNCLESIPAGSLSGLTSLTDLTLAGNRLSALPPRELAPLGRLRKLALNGNRLGGPEGGAGAGGGGGGQLDLGVGAHMTALTELMLQGNCLETVDPHIFECPALQELSLADNQLTQLPPRMAGASSLARLHLFGNRLTHVSARQLAGLPSLASCWLEGNPLAGETVSELISLAASGAMPQLKALGLDQTQMAAAPGRPRDPSADGSSSSSPGSSGGLDSLPKSVRVGCVLGSGPGYFKLQYGPQRPAAGGGDGAGFVASWGAAGTGPAAGGPSCAGGCGGVGSSNELLVVAFGSAPGTPNWGGLLSKVYRAATAEEGRYFDVLYVADPARDWYGGGDDSVYGYYRERLSSYTRHYRRVLLLGDSMGATATLLFADLATAALAFCPQVDLTAASIRPGRPAAWLDRLRERLVASVTSSRGELAVLVGTWHHDLAQANMLPTARSGSGAGGGDAGSEDAGAGAGGSGRGGRGSATRNWREEGAIRARASGSSAAQAPAGPAAQRKPWAWEQCAEGSGGRGAATQAASSAAGLQKGGDGASAGKDSGSGGVSVKVFSVDSHRLAAALDARGQLVPLVLDAVLHQLGLRSGNVRVANIL